MTDNEIIKAMECCYDGGKCKDCPLNGLKHCGFEEKVLDFVNRQKAEIEKLKEQLADARYLNTVAESDGIKEFAERLKQSFLDLDVQINTGKRKTIPVDEYIKLSEWLLHEVAIQEIDNIVKEMTEEKENA